MKIETAPERIKAAVGSRGCVAEPAEQEPYLVEARRLWRGARKHFGDARPGSATIIVKALVAPEWLIEIEAVAAAKA